MYLIEFSIKGTIYRMVLDEKKQDKTIKKIVIDKLWKEFPHYADSEQAMADITISHKISFKCEGCNRPVKIEEYLRNKTICCQKCFETSYLPFYYDLVARIPDYRVLHDGDGVFIISE